MLLKFKQFESFRIKSQDPIQRSFPGKEQTVILPKGDKLTGMVEKVDIDMLVPIQDEWAVWNETSKAMSMGEYIIVSDDMKDEVLYMEGKIVSEDNLPPVVIDKNYNIIDGHHRWAALQMSGFKKINIIRYEN